MANRTNHLLIKPDILTCYQQSLFARYSLVLVVSTYIPVEVEVNVSHADLGGSASIKSRSGMGWLDMEWIVGHPSPTLVVEGCAVIQAQLIA